ncbi:UNVERIFIED_CONTAM: hypothetical protein Slati_1368300 [Sesamum latifolium]|uniref:Uncharacterized protein n=1 Tax=Sesamum latifolium TaxID=2727402 RepID=A0AAW2XLZ4_9LAMI
MTRELQNAGCELSDEQQVLVVLSSLPEQTWGYVKLVLIHNEQIKAFGSVVIHLKLEANHRESERAQQAALSHIPVCVSPIKATIETNRLV